MNLKRVDVAGLLVLAAQVLVALADTAYYELLDIDKGASQKEIKRAFHAMATKYHPDKNSAKGAEEKFREIAHAYEVLSDPEKRRKYDRHGKSAFENGGSGGGAANAGHFTFASFDEIFKHFDSEGDAFHFSFGGNDFNGMGDGFDNDDSFSSFGFGDMFGDEFGNGDSFFGTHFGDNDGHFGQQSQYGHHHVRSSNGGYSKSESSSYQSGRSCRTVTQKVGNMITTYTQCT